MGDKLAFCIARLSLGIESTTDLSIVVTRVIDEREELVDVGAISAQAVRGGE